MKLLALRGENLASLAGRFEIDFEAEPIRGAGIFVVTGPTGAGKSTLLDAICLALFDRLPRLEGAESSGAVGRAGGTGELVKYDDVRGVLRHGAGVAVAEVDFLGQDRRRYRARWEVRRARNRADGKLQSQKLTLTDRETGRVVGDKKTDTLQEIELRIGLNFDQFRRAVLLAQGEFDTFIKARSKDRAELLERITGTAIYSALSRGASARAKRAREALALLEAQSGSVIPLSADVRIAAEAKHEHVRRETERSQGERAALERARQWHRTRTELAAGVAAAHTAVAKTQETDAMAGPEREALAKARRALSLRAEVVTMRDCAGRLEHALRRRRDAERDEIAAGGRHEAAVAARDAEAAAHADILRRYEAAGLDLDRAQVLDARLGDAASALDRGRAAEDDARRANEKATAAFATQAAMVGELEVRRRQVLAWLDHNRPVEALAQRLDTILADIADAADRTREAAAARGRVAEAQAALEKAAADAETYSAVVRRVAPELAAAEATLAGLHKAIEAFDREAIFARRDALDRSRLALASAQAASTALERAARVEAASAAEVSRHALARTHAADRFARARSALPEIVARLEEAERGLSLSRAAGDAAVAHLRLNLRPGEPCPVCGASEHVPQAVDAVLRARLSQDEARVGELRAALQDLRSNAAGAEAARDAAVQAGADADARRIECAAERAAALQRLLDATTSIRAGTATTKLALATDPPSRAEINDCVATVETDLAAAVAALASDAKAQEEARRIAATRDRSRAQLVKSETAANAARALMDTASARIEQAGEDARRGGHDTDRLHARIDAVLASALPGWRDNADLPAACRSLAMQWRDRQAAAGETERALDDTRPELARARAEASASSETLQAATASAAAARDAVGALRDARLAILDGRAVQDVRAGFDGGLADAATRLRQADSERVAHEVQRGACATASAVARQDVDRVTHESGAAQLALDARLAAEALSLAETEAAIAVGEDALRADDARLEALRQAAQQARAVAQERGAALARHLASDAPPLDAAATDQRLHALVSEEAATAAALQQAGAVLMRDDDMRQRQQALDANIAAQREKGRVWEQLDQLIGSADGSKFRRYAQSLTLDTLVTLANRHLWDLQPRYELQRAPDGDMALQVIDRDMAEEVRGLHNLSGGERFLVSLALALGLASMSSSEGVRVESLFIDEGFGALDPHSLGLAISVLERLQASGRQVGVISHVEEVKERIAVKVQVAPAGNGRSKVTVFAS